MNATASQHNNEGLTQQQIVKGLRNVGLKDGDVVFVHAAMRTMGPVRGGADTVAEALLEVIGDRGTLVVPTFTFASEKTNDPIVDPQNDPSEMGIISERVRLRPGARRSVAYKHSVAAIGRRAEVITSVDPALSVFDLRSSFGVMLALNTKVLLLGVTFESSTSHHFAEWLCDVPYRHSFPLNVRVRRPDASVVMQTMTDHTHKPSTDGSYYGNRHPDFNRLGRMLEEKHLVGIGVIGNAVVRRFAMRDLCDLAQVEILKDGNIFRTEEGKTGTDDYTPLTFGTIVTSPVMRDGAGREVQYQWCVLDEKKLVLPTPES